MALTSAEKSRLYRARHPEESKEYSKNYKRKHYISTRNGQVKADKRDYPNGCELCGNTKLKLDYHHWIDTVPGLGIWVCLFCHKFCDNIDKGLHIIYLQRKAGIIMEWIDKP